MCRARMPTSARIYSAHTVKHTWECAHIRHAYMLLALQIRNEFTMRQYHVRLGIASSVQSCVYTILCYNPRTQKPPFIPTLLLVVVRQKGGSITSSIHQLIKYAPGTRQLSSCLPIYARMACVHCYVCGKYV